MADGNSWTYIILFVYNKVIKTSSYGKDYYEFRILLVIQQETTSKVLL